MTKIVNNNRSTALEQSVKNLTGKREGGGGCLYWFYVATILSLSSAVVYTRLLFSPREGFPTWSLLVVLSYVINKWGCSIDIIKQSACLAVNKITVYHFAYLFYCTPEGRGGGSGAAGGGSGFNFYVCFLAHRGLIGVFFLPSTFPMMLFVNPGTSRCLKMLFL